VFQSLYACLFNVVTVMCFTCLLACIFISLTYNYVTECLKKVNPVLLCVDINECASSPCQNGGTCTDAVNSYTCTCAAGYDGALCQNSTYIFKFLKLCAVSIKT